MKRTQKSFINVMTSFLTNAVFLITAFVVQKTLIATKGAEYNSINGLFSSIISMMSLADLGIGTAIIYHMYRPVAERDEEKINSLLMFYKRCYLVISGVVLLIGIPVGLLLPRWKYRSPDSIYLIYALFLADCIALFSPYKVPALCRPEKLHTGCYLFCDICDTERPADRSIVILQQLYSVPDH